MATIADKSRSKEIIDRLQGMLNSASPVPLASGKVSIYKDEMQSLLDELAMQMDAEIKTYHEVNDRRGKIITEAKKEAEKIIYEAEHTASRMRVTKRSTNVAALDHTALTDEEIYSLTEANEIYAASLIYTDEMLTEVSKMIEDAYHNIRSDYEVVMHVMEDKLNTIMNNKNELMSGLQELDAKDRSQQIMEIGQLLSDELYNERMKKRMNSDEYDDGSVQLSLDLQVEQAEESARQAHAYAMEAAQALEQMTAERDALRQTVIKMEKEKKAEEFVAKKEEKAPVDESKKAEETASVATASSDEEYEIVYVTEDELEEGEEYEIEYIDEDEYEKLVADGKIEAEVKDTEAEMKMESNTAVTETEKTQETTSKEEKTESKPVDASKEKEDNTKKNPEEKKKEGLPGVVDVSTDIEEEDDADADTVRLNTNDVKNAEDLTKQAEEKKSGLIRRAVQKREEEEVVVKVEPVEEVKEEQTDADGNKYVQATMKFDENFDITEF